MFVAAITSNEIIEQEEKRNSTVISVVSDSVLVKIDTVKLDTVLPCFNPTKDTLNTPCLVIKDSKEYNKQFFRNEEDFVLFIKYIKTQQNTYGKDCEAVIMTMLNRMRHHTCDWNTYYNTRSINNSNSIRLMKKNVLKPVVDTTNANDKAIIDFALAASNGEIVWKDFEDVLFFESFPVSPNKGVHKISKLKVKYVHKFYTL